MQTYHDTTASISYIGFTPARKLLLISGALKMQDLKMTDLDISKLAHKTCMASKATVK